MFSRLRLRFYVTTITDSDVIPMITGKTMNLKTISRVELDVISHALSCFDNKTLVKQSRGKCKLDKEIHKRPQARSRHL